MRKVALKIEHKYKNRKLGNHSIENPTGLTTLGSAVTADIRLMGDEVSGLHAAFEFDKETGWTLSDLGSASGTWVNKKPIIEQSVDGATIIHIGHHQLRAEPYVHERPLFAQNKSETGGQQTYHQVVVLKRGLVVSTHLLKANETFHCELPGVGRLPAPTSKEWIVGEHGAYTIKQRLTNSDELKETLAQKLGDDWKRPQTMATVALVFLFFFGFMVLMPQKPDDSMKTLTPDMQNQYTRLIFDGKKVRSKKAIAEKLRQDIKGQSQQGVAKSTPGGDAGAKAASANKAPAGAKVVLNLKNAGLGALIGKVAARAAKNAQLVESAGVAADSPTSGRALGVGGGSALDALGGGGGGGETQKVAGIGTAGKGGGSTGYKGTGALSLGNVGNAEVGAMEEESEVDGGLDKEAIARVIRQQLGQIRYCYERQLSANPDLYGKILVKFTIGSAGSVVTQAIGNTSLNNAMVEGCILRRIAGWQFPTPKGGTSVLVTYPFLFKSTR